MFVEGEVEIKIKDRTVAILDDHGMKLWIQRSFKEMCCYRISSYRQNPDKSVRAVVALKLDVLPENERTLIQTHPNDVGLLRSFIEKMFVGKGSCRAVGDPKLRES
jgi:hypothetical protein